MGSACSVLECELMDCKARIHILSAKIGKIQGNVESVVQDEIEKLREKERIIRRKIHQIKIKTAEYRESLEILRINLKFRACASRKI